MEVLKSPKTDSGSADPANERAALALHAAGMGEFEWDIEHDTVDVSDRMAAITGLQAGPQPADGGEAIWRHIHPNDVEGVRQDVRDALVDKGSFEVRFRIVRPDTGRIQWLYGAGLRLPGPPPRLVGAVQDITDRRHADDGHEA